MIRKHKRLLSVGILCAIIISCSGCGNHHSDSNNNNAPNSQSHNEDTEKINTDSPVISKFDIDKITVSVDAAICSEWEKGLSYNDKTDEAIWSSLMYIMRDYTKSTEKSSEAVINISRDKLITYLSNIFCGLDKLPQRIPVTFQHQIKYSQNDDSYIISPVYREETLTRLSDVTEKNDGIYVATADLYTADTNELLASWEVILEANPLYSSENTISSRLSLKELNLSKVYQTTHTFTKTATFLGLSDTHTVEVQFSSGEISAFQFYEEEVSGALSGFYSGESFTFTYNLNRETGISEIIEIY